jgi:ribonuclease-3
MAETGPDHAKTFTVAAHINGYEPVEGSGASKQKAEQAAASAALEKYFPDQNNVL